MKQGTRSGILFVLGYGLYKAAGGSGYLSAMGMAGDNTGFVSVDAFMFANTASSVLVCLLVALVATRTSFRFPKRAVAVFAYACLVLDFLVVPRFGSPVVVGIVYGVSAMLLSVTWFVACVERTDDPPIFITCGLLLSTALQAVLGSYGLPDLAFLPVVLLAVSAALLLVLFATTGTVAREGVPLKLRTRASSVFFPALLCLMVCAFVVGVSNVAALGSSLEPLFGGVNMQMTNLVVAIAAATIVFCGAAAPNPVKAYTCVLPVLFVVFSLIPIVGEGLGPVGGSVMVGCYQAIAILFAAFSVKLATVERLDPVALAPLCFGGSSLALLLGLVTGTALGMLGSKGLPLPVLVMLVSVYPLGLVLFFVTRRRKGAHDVQVDAGPAVNEDASGEEVEAAFRKRAADIAQEYGLTQREEEILFWVARGRSARVISEELFISENTTWSHIKRIYSKTGKHSKQAVLDLFEGGLSS